MRNAVTLPNGLILTTDNSAGIGEKEMDVVHTDDEVVAYFAARVCLLEQWAANAIPKTIIVHNFSGDQSWEKYVRGIYRLFQEIEGESPAITGSTETNMDTVQSAIAITMIGEQKQQMEKELSWFVYGKPSVGNEVLANTDKIASLQKIQQAREKGIVHRVWPVGSSGILEECRRIGLSGKLENWDTEKSAGPATTVILGVDTTRVHEAQQHFGEYFHKIG